MMQQNLVSGKTKLADSRLLLFKITSVFARSCAWWWFAGYQMVPGYWMVPGYRMAPDISLLGTGLERACLWLT